jgi:hypothetical protein
MHRERVVALLLAGSAPVMAAELVVRDLGVRVEALPTAFTYTVDNDSFQRSGTDYFSTAFALAGGGRYSLAGPGQSWGGVLGGDVALADARNDHSHLLSAELRAVAGLGWQMGHDYTACLQVAVGIGYGRMSMDQAGASSAGRLSSLTPGLSLWWRSDDHMRLTVDAGWRMQDAVLRSHGSSFDLRQSGAYVAIGIVWGISRAPWSLE